MKIFSRILAPLAVAAAIFLAPFTAQAQFADQATYVATPGGTANAITLTVPNWTRNIPGVPIRFLPAAQNTGATTVVVNGIGSAVAIRKPTGNGVVALTGGEINTTEVAEITFDGTQWNLGTSPPPPSAPQGYLTPCQVSSPSPVAGCTAGEFFPVSDVTSATTLFYEGVTGKYVPIFNGGQFVPTAVTEAQMTLILSGTANTANNLYDVCIYNNAGTPAIGTMPAWSNAGAGTSARSAAISQVQGIWLNTATVTVTNNNVGVSVAANRCTVVATILIDGVNGQVSFQRSIGQNRRWATWNFYNRQTIYLQVTDATASWNPNAGNLTTGMASNNNTANNMRVVTGLAEEPVEYDFIQYALQSGGNSQSDAGNFIGINSSTVTCGKAGRFSGGVAGATVTNGSDMVAKCWQSPALGLTQAFAGQIVTNNVNARTFFGTSANMLMTGRWRG